jgi:hypothetical protein
VTCRLKPGSLTATGAVIDVDGREHAKGPCFVPRDYGASIRHLLGRCAALDDAGWRMLRDCGRWPGIPRNRTDICIIRSNV